jgi:hypothetical protein
MLGINRIRTIAEYKGGSGGTSKLGGQKCGGHTFLGVPLFLLVEKNMFI